MAITAASVPAATDVPVSAVSWAAIIAGAVAASALSMILMLLGSGIGLTMISPWTGAGVTATTFAVSTVIWLIVVQWVSSGVGGYLAGRLRTLWTGVHRDEVFFRDTAHGFLTWSLSTIIVAAVLSSAVSSAIGTGVKAASTVASGVAQGGAQGASQMAGSSNADPTAYLVDTLFRAPATAGAPATNQGDYRAEALRILVSSAAAGQMSDADRAYLAQLVNRETGIPAADAETRVKQVLAQLDEAKQQAKKLADDARKASATLSILTFAALLIGAFIAAVAAALGGRQRDEYGPVV